MISKQFLINNEEEILRTLNEIFPGGLSIGGSAALILRGYIDRDLHDIDIDTTVCYYATGNVPRCQNESRKFRGVNGNIVKCFGSEIRIKNEYIHVDVFYDDSLVLVKGEAPMIPTSQLFRYKAKYISDRGFNRPESLKHILDIRQAINKGSYTRDEVLEYLKPYEEVYDYFNNLRY